jgi:uncharacterized protein YdeI (YjbR/CyaY-like superfamily)
MNPTNSKVDVILRKAKRWPDELKELRRILLESDLTEELKWRQACYTFDGHNVAIIGEFKDYCALSFFKGALLNDSKKILGTPGENTQSGRVIRFTNIGEIIEKESTLKSYIRQAIELEKAGKKVTFKKITEHKVPEELETKFDEMPALRTAFQALTPGRQRSYLLHFSSARQSSTRTSRIEKCVDDIIAGKGFNENYMSKKKKPKKPSGS